MTENIKLEFSVIHIPRVILRLKVEMQNIYVVLRPHWLFGVMSSLKTLKKIYGNE